MMEGANNHEEPSTMKKVKWTEWNKHKNPLFVGACFSSRFYAPIWFLTYLFFVSFCLGGRKLWVDWREVLVPFGLRERFLKGSFGSFQFEKSLVKGSFGFLPGDWEREILTKVRYRAPVPREGNSPHSAGPVRKHPLNSLPYCPVVNHTHHGPY